MFWKSGKDKKKDKDSFEISFESDRRAYYRVRPPDDQPLFFRTAERNYRLDDLSAGGMALRGERLPVGQQLSGLLRLPTTAAPLPMVRAVVGFLEDRGSLATSILKIKDGHREILHQYVLECQKQELERRRNQEKSPAPSPGQVD